MGSEGWEGGYKRAGGVAAVLKEVQWDRSSCLDVAEEYTDHICTRTFGCKSLSTSRAKIQFSNQKPFLRKSGFFAVLCR